MALDILLRMLAFPAFVFTVYLFQAVGATERPIIGILTHEIDQPPNSYIAASYVKAVESSGARVVPILLSKEEEYYKKLVDSLNGVLFPGGDARPTTVGGYFDAVRYIFKYTRQLQAEGDQFPLLGVCLGMEALAIMSNEDYTSNRTLDACPGVEAVHLPLIFRPDFRDSSLYKDLPETVEEILRTENVTANSHMWCVRPDQNLTLPWHILTLNTDSDGKEFVSSMELDGPIAGVQFHPEKNPYEWEQYHPSYEDGLLASRHFYDWLVTEARKNNHSFKDRKEEQDSLIYNYSPEFTGKDGGYFTQRYVFNANSGIGMLLNSTFLIIISAFFTSIHYNSFN